MGINRILLGMSVLALLSVACSRQSDDATGKVSFALAAEDMVKEVTRSSLSDYTTLPAAGSFNIVLTKVDGDEIYNGPLEDYDASTSLKTGNYLVKASYGSVDDEGFDKPCLEGEKSFSIVGGGTTAVTVPVSLSNSLVRVDCTSNFKSYYTDYSFTVKTGGGTEIPFPADESRAAFVDAYTISVSGTVTSQGGKTQTFSKEYTSSLSPKTCYTLKFDVSNVGGVRVTISFDDTVTDAELIDVELND